MSKYCLNANNKNYESIKYCLRLFLNGDLFSFRVLLGNHIPYFNTLEFDVIMIAIRANEVRLLK